ncbi:MAG: ABC transporter ATP-binding protein [Desulfobacterales bacterium]|jgi:simple sugar transport system ATP-binding protein
MTTNKPIIKMIGITKNFPGVVANNNVDLDLHPAEIHSILGENGAGKTTLMKILAGMHLPDAGTIIVRNQAVNIRVPRDSLRLGIGMVYQHFTLVPELTVLENLILGFESGFFLNLKKAEQKLKQISAAYGLTIDPDRMIHDLSVSECQRTEILKILFHGSDVLILDEPSSMLSPAETEDLFDTLRSLRKTGKSVVLITHNLSEAISISDRITVMRSGKNAAELSGEMLMAMDEKTATNRILEVMFGVVPEPQPRVAVQGVSTDETTLELRQVDVLNNQGAAGLKRISFSIAKGEILGITGVDGEDRRLLAEVIGGQQQPAAGQLLYRGRDITPTDIATRFELGIRYVTEDRINEGCVIDMTLTENTILQSYYRPPFSRFGILNQARIQSFTGDLISRFGIRAAGPDARVGTLSGGNIQKFILARYLSGEPGLIVCSNPTYGLDATTVRLIRQLLREESRRGAAILLITPDMDELFSCSNRIGVLFNGGISELMDPNDATIEIVGKLMLGISE